MKRAKQQSHLNNEKGNALIETLPILVIFIVLLSFALGLFGVVHTGIMNSMAARTYAFETFSNRSDTTLFRDRKVELYYHYEKIGNRVHTVDSEKKVTDNLSNVNQYATTRKLGFGRDTASTQSSSGSVNDHNVRIYEISGRNRQGGVEASPAWVMVSYGLCNDAQCGDQ